MPKQMNFGDPADPSALTLQQPFTRAACPFGHITVHFVIVLLNLSFPESSISINFGKYRQNLTKHGAYEKSDPNDRTNTAINLDPTDYDATDSEVQKKRFFSF